MLSGAAYLFLMLGWCCAQDNPLRVGVSRLEITPTLPVTMAGYESRKELSRGVHDPLSARAVAFEQGDQHLVLVSVDILGFYNGTADPLRKAILDACSLEPSELFLAAIHTHSAPSPALDPARGHSNNVAFTRTLQTRLVQVVREALERLAPATLAAGPGSSPVGVNRRQVIQDDLGNPSISLGRNPDRLTDREVQVLRLNRAGADAPFAVLFAYDTHSTSLGPGNYLISGDVHGLAEQFVERYLGGAFVAAGFAGASGDIDPWYRVLPEFRTTNGWIPEPVLQGTMLGEEVARALEAMPRTDLSGAVNTRLKTLELPGKAPGELRATNNLPASPFTITVGRVGQVAFVGLGGEVFNGIGQTIKRASPFKTTFVFTHCNAAGGYLPTPDAFLEGGYEVRTSRFAPGASDQVVRETLRLLHAL